MYLFTHEQWVVLFRTDVFNIAKSEHPCFFGNSGVIQNSDDEIQERSLKVRKNISS
jgi:hypothetical protein